MAQSPRPPGPVGAAGSRGLLSSWAQGRPRVVRGFADRRLEALGLRVGSVRPNTSLRRGPNSKRVSQAGWGLHDTARSRPGSDPGPTQAQPRWPAGRGPAAFSFARFLSFPLPPSRSSTLRRAPGQARPGLPSAADPAVRAPEESWRARAHTHSAPEAMARASPGRRLWRPAANGYKSGRRPTRPGLGSLRLGEGWRAAATNPQGASLSLPPSGTRAAGGRETLADSRGGSGSEDSNDGCKRLAETESRKAESSEGKPL